MSNSQSVVRQTEGCSEMKDILDRTLASKQKDFDRLEQIKTMGYGQDLPSNALVPWLSNPVDSLHFNTKWARNQGKTGALPDGNTVNKAPLGAKGTFLSQELNHAPYKKACVNLVKTLPNTLNWDGDFNSIILESIRIPSLANAGHDYFLKCKKRSERIEKEKTDLALADSRLLMQVPINLNCLACTANMNIQAGKSITLDKAELNQAINCAANFVNEQQKDKPNDSSSGSGSSTSASTEGSGAVAALSGKLKMTKYVKIGMIVAAVCFMLWIVYVFFGKAKKP